MGEFAEMCRDLRSISAERRAHHRESSPAMLRGAGVRFETFNGGAHLVVESGNSRIDFWPGTGLWIPRDGTRRGRGVRKLLAKIRKEERR